MNYFCLIILDFRHEGGEFRVTDDMLTAYREDGYALVR